MNRHRFDRCQYLSGDPARRSFCDRPVRPGSAYCPDHHRLCHPPPGSGAYRRVLREFREAGRFTALSPWPPTGAAAGDGRGEEP
ncbi:hypothetical protein [Rhodospirillum rubrum]|uniref:GcrA cell cycle regulator n=1 Tax=Rhodospirillum rubrum (strain ATCC 11170 / ATH 1.1.1 / DSM 467 / LMG 4362 / NCIMB 8255 / S1) TaxID=269796 RepID=Q2RSF6_RHORT|nr:hypothetical protein [Rhodospirillum rubrum]ABC22939.1 hypothetical protein Rru_A2139 [Rhodospirillum rubrum ATCC 11170]AEO48667.1 hypothetical protein F11_11015 [Rhodospirillum rubrum F11]MBK5954560.1 hypothetical protein [Rhodospirillum rubrum]QXG78926.1 hypothetical protein KUL73_11065 [Rhodospirillum rubrum]HCF16571.1 hypothetical protein [Rhodospirillum rubrum]